MLIYEYPGLGDIYSQLISPDNLEARAEALVAAGAAVTLQGARAILNTTINLIVGHNCERKIPQNEALGYIKAHTFIQFRWQSS